MSVILFTRPSFSRDRGIHTSAVIGSGVLVGAVLLALAAPDLRRCVCDEDGGESQSGSPVGKHVVVLHDGRIGIAESLYGK
jgi:hypothetical protein